VRYQHSPLPISSFIPSRVAGANSKSIAQYLPSQCGDTDHDETDENIKLNGYRA
jgi:hypothetical protein